MAIQVENGTTPQRTFGEPPASEVLAAHLMEHPGKGEGLMYRSINHATGVSLQLGAVALMLALIGGANTTLFTPALGMLIVPVAATVGAIATFFGGMWNLHSGNVIAGVIGALYGVFFLSLALILNSFSTPIVAVAGNAGFGDAFGLYLLAWAIISAGIALATFYVNRIVFIQQSALIVIFGLLAFGNMAAPGGSGLLHLGGYIALANAALTFYISTAFLVNDTAGKDVLPLF